MKQYDVIVFDVDDTLMDFDQSEQAAFGSVFGKYEMPDGLNQYRSSYRTISEGLWRDLENGNLGLSELGSERFRRLFLEHELDLDAVVFNQDYLGFLGEQRHLVPGAEKVIEALSHKRLAIITNGFEAVQTSRIRNSPFRDAFEQVIISETTGYRKPQKGIFEYAFRQLQVTDPSTVLMVGDSLTSDIQGGLNAGVDTCWFNPARRENQTPIVPTYEISRLEELLEIIL